MVKQKPASTVGVRFTADDYKLAAALRKKLRVKALSELIRMGLQALADKEGVTA